MFLLNFTTKIYARNNTICLKFKNICFPKFIDFPKITLPLTKIASKRDCVSCHESSLILIQPPSGLYPAFLEKKLDQFWEIRSQHYAQRNINNGTPMTKITSFPKKHFRNKVAIKEKQIGRGDIIANLGRSFV